MTNMSIINEVNNNTIFAISGKKQQLGDGIIDTRVDIQSIPGYYKTDDTYRPYTFYGNGEF